MSQQQMEKAKVLGDKTLKPFNIPREHIARLVPSMGCCLATDRILIDGMRVGYMYREQPEGEDDSGWVFLAGDETQEYLDDQWNFGVYAVNTICNYDPEIIPLIDEPPPSAFERNHESGKFERVDPPREG